MARRSPDHDAEEIVTGLGKAGRRVRLLAAAALFGALLAGTIWGDDVHFPFGPFRMYASAEALDGTTSWFLLVGVDAAGRREEVPTEALGLRRAELEGRIAEITADPDLLAGLARLYLERHPDVSLARLEVVRRSQSMEAGVPSGDPVDEVVAAWAQP